MSQLSPSDDPYRSPAPEPPDNGPRRGELERGERALLNMYYAHRDRPFTLRELLVRMLPQWLLLALLMAMLLLAVYALFPRGSIIPRLVAVGVLGSLVGAISRDLGVARRLVSMWPIFQEIFDWEKLAARLDHREVTEPGTEK